ncbi:peroxisomal membrane protein 11B-like [Lingula anatina]|uniref:Peroxisomal membrane protein 11B-like n=1 Tax=Lingula anatina TaxID=7574 RepID=A0A1S3J8G3_LINAN|nr:peroxisomal membrane protein 11B-like [Lingula anatina]|eukprot:XP_013406692.1 peroxisomal membrane protein 11B-like [Lingula anatina]
MFSKIATWEVLRFGKSFDLLHSSLSTIHISDTVLRLTITLSHINQALYLLVDHIVWASKIGLIETQRKYWSKLSARFWLVSLILNLTRNIYDISNLVQEEQKHLHQWDKRSQYKNGIGGYKDIERKTPTSMEIFQKCLRENHPVAIDTAKNFCDLLLPLSSLGFVKTSKGLQGILGMISSYLSILTIWNPDLKLQNP